MSFRARLLLAFIVVVLVPLAILSLGIRREMGVRVVAQADRRAESLAEVIAADLADVHMSVGNSVTRIARALPDDPAFRAGVLRGEGAERAYTIDYAAAAMHSAGLTMLQIRNDSGRIVSSGHFPAEHGRVDPSLPDTLASRQGTTLVAMRTAEGALTGVARVDSVSIAGRRFTVVGAQTVDQRFIDRLARGDEMGVRLTLPGGTLRSAASAAQAAPVLPGAAGAQTLRVLPIAYLDATSVPVVAGSAELSIARSTADVDALRNNVDRWILLAFLIATAVAVLAALWLAARLSRPMEELAAAAGTVDLDRLDVRFAAGRDDEIGTLSRRLASMVDRLRASTARLREAERRATVGDIARQVNHDIRNGLAPIRNVVRHLSQVARDDPAQLPAIFTGRQTTLDASIDYLETLAQNYARLSPALAGHPSDADRVIVEVVSGAGARGATVRARSAGGVAPVRADAVVLRRIIENLVSNAVDSLEGKPGDVTVTTEPVTDPRGLPFVRITVADSGRGMNERELARAFDDFHTTKATGTGLGLSVVRRLVADLGGTLRVETEPGIGTRISVDLPAAAAARPVNSTAVR